MEIRFEEYLSEEERKEIVASVFRRECEKELKDSEERILSNTSYRIVTQMVDEIFDGKLNELLVNKTKEIIDNLCAYTVFRNPSRYDMEPTTGYKCLQEAVQESKPLLQKRVAAIIEGLDEEVLRELIKEEALYLLDTKLFGGK